MAGGPLFPISALPRTGAAFGWIYVGSGPGQQQLECLGVKVYGLSVDGIWGLTWRLPGELPGGSPYLHLTTISIASNGYYWVEPQWVTVGSWMNPGSANLGSEGVNTLTFTNSSIGVLYETKIALDVSSMFGGGTVLMNLVFDKDNIYMPPYIVGLVPTIIWE